MTDSATIGIVGGGQLGKMLTIAAKKLGFSVIVLDPTPDSPAGQVADKQIIADYKDEKAIRKLGSLSNFITFEIELANDLVLQDLIKEKKHVNPLPETLSIIRDKLRQKEFLRSNLLPTADFMEVNSPEDVKNAALVMGFPMLLKARFDAYDGRGNFVIKNSRDIKKGFEILKGRDLYVEKFVPFIKELAVMVARGHKGEIAVYPVTQTIHIDNICDTVIVPAAIPDSSEKKAELLARKTMKYLTGAGVFGIEMFLKKDGSIIINEIAPRVHNSGHYTYEATMTSQFEQHIRAITNLPLGSTSLLPKAVVMKNILGKKNGSGIPQGLEKALAIPGVSVHIYNKHESRPKRKMGHITVMGDSVQECLRKANKARNVLII